MKEPIEQHAWVAQARTLLEHSAQGLDAAALSRLNRARQAALAQRRRRMPHPWWLSAGAASACALMVAVFAWHAHVATVNSQEFPLATKNVAASDMELVSGDDSLEFYQDLEFYAWLDAQDQDLGS